MSGLATDTVVGVIGAGTMGAGIAQVAAAAGHPVLLHDAQDGAVETGLARTRAGLEKLIDRGRLERDAVEALLSRIQPAAALADLASSGLVVEAIVEDLGVKRQVFADLERHCGDGAILASNTSSLSLTAIAAELERPERVVGMHFFNPVPVMKLVEVVSGLATDGTVAATVASTAEAWGKIAVQARSTPGFIVNRVARPFYAEALRVLQEGGADPATIDAVMREAGGFRMGPFELMDLIGHDVNAAVTESVFAAYHYDPRYKPSPIQQELVLAGHLGRKSGRGFYDYAEGAQREAPTTAPAGPEPAEIHVRGQLGPTQRLVDRAQTAGLAVELQPEGDSAIEIDGVLLWPCDGRSATQLSAELRHNDVVVFDLCLDYADAPRIAVAAADGAGKEAVAVACGLFQALGMAVSVIDDVPGLILARTVAMLANEGGDAVLNGVCDADAVDLAMRYGVNYPRGPLAWADRIGDARVVRILDHLQAHYGEDRYRASPYLRRRHWAGRPLNE